MRRAKNFLGKTRMFKKGANTNGN